MMTMRPDASVLCAVLFLCLCAQLAYLPTVMSYNPPPPPPPPPPPVTTEPPNPPTLPPGKPPSSTPNAPLFSITMVPGTYTHGTQPGVANTGAEYAAGMPIWNGVGQSQSVGMTMATAQQYVALEYLLINAGEVDPSSAAQCNDPFQYSPNYVVVVNAHLSGEQSSPSAVGTVTTIVIDSQGHTVYTNTVTGWGGNFAPLEEQAGSNVNGFFTSLIEQNQ